jgi:uncharacterized lipoprotein YddW (UPF0748 family)
MRGAGWLRDGRLVAAVVLPLLAVASIARAQTTPAAAGQYRGFWVDTFNTRFATPDDVAAIVGRATQARANLIVVQVRRRGDAWYLDGREPLPEGVSFPADFDPLRELLVRGHDAGLAIHAAVTIGAIWNQATPPQHPAHVFNQHGFTASGPLSGRQNWLTRMRPGEPTPAPSLGGYRFGLDFWLDPGHPDAAAYTVDVVTDLVARYPIDGLHLDGLRYPEVVSAAGGTEWSPSVGYNDTSLERFRRRQGLPADTVPPAADPAWSAWRREQVTALLRRLTLAALAQRPALVVSAGLAASGDAPAGGAEAGASTDEAWRATEAYGRVFQDWYQWSDAGLVDLLVPLVYRPEHVAAGAEAFGAWVAWTQAHAAGRHVMIALGAHLNAIEGTLRQVRRATEVLGGADQARPADGIIVFSMGAHNAPVASNPLAIGGPRDTPYRSFDDLAAGLVTGRTTAGHPIDSSNAVPLFAQPAPLPPLPWKVEPTSGHVRGTVLVASTGRAVDGATLQLEPDTSTVARTFPAAAEPMPVALAPSDGGGAFGALGVAPGRYRVIVTPPGDGQYRSTCAITVVAGIVATIALQIDPARPALAVCMTP